MYGMGAEREGSPRRRTTGMRTRDIRGDGAQPGSRRPTVLLVRQPASPGTKQRILYDVLSCADWSEARCDDRHLMQMRAYERGELLRCGLGARAAYCNLHQRLLLSGRRNGWVTPGKLQRRDSVADQSLADREGPCRSSARGNGREDRGHAATLPWPPIITSVRIDPRRAAKAARPCTACATWRPTGRQIFGRSRGTGPRTIRDPDRAWVVPTRTKPRGEDEEDPASTSEQTCMDDFAFQATMTRLRDAWVARDADLAADCFETDATYCEPPLRQWFAGKESLREFFSQLPEKVQFDWHHLWFDARCGMGAGAYSYKGRNCYEGIAIVEVGKDAIANWREYQYPGPSTADRSWMPRPSWIPKARIARARARGGPTHDGR
jgi:hypothetical protein